MKKTLILLSFLSLKAFAHARYVDTNIEREIQVSTSVLYSFDSSLASVVSNTDLSLKVRLSTFKNFLHSNKRISGELLLSQGNLVFSNSLVKNLLLQDIKGHLQLRGGRVEYSEFQELQIDTLNLYNIRIQNTIWRGVVARDSEFKDVVFNETDFQGVSLPGLRAENVKFLGRTAGMNLSGCNLRNVEFYFDRIEYLSLVGCQLENVYVNGRLFTEAKVLKRE